MRGIKKRGIIFLLCCIIFISLLSISFAIPFASAADVAYIYNKDFKIDQNVIGVFNDLGLSVDTIKSSEVSGVDFSQYRLIFVGDEKFPNPRLIPVNDYPSIIANYYHGQDWDITDADGISKVAGTKPLEVETLGGIIPVYIYAFFNPGSTVAIPYYYLDNNNKAPGFEEIAGTHVGTGDQNLGAVIAYANASSRLSNGEFANGKMCFYGIVKSDFWTPEAKQLFNDCAAFVATTCSNDNDCSDDSIGDPYCDGKNIYRDNIDYSCQNPGSLDALCIGVPQNKTFVEECTSACFNGGCVECNVDADCNDNNSGTIDQCNDNHACEHIPIPCQTDSDCNDNNNRTIDECVNPGDEDSFCRNTEVNCLTNTDCGFTGFLGQEFCSADDVFKNFQNSTCANAGTLQSNCVVTQTQQQVNECGEDFCTDTGSRYCSNNSVYQNRVCTDRGCSSNNNSVASCVSNPQDEAVLIQACQFGCSNGICLNQPVCSNDADCNDNNAYTQDICLNPGTPQAQCVHNPIQCNNNADCNDNNALTIDQCINYQCNYTIIECNSNADCDDSNPQTTDICVNPGTVNSTCINTPLQCINNAQCGNPSSNVVCIGDNRVNVTQTPQCVSNNCNIQFLNITLQNCQYGCQNGVCLSPNIACSNDGQCNDNNPYTHDMCMNPSTPQSQCIYHPIACLTNADCNDNNAQTTDICVNPGTMDSYCQHTPMPPVCGNNVKESGEQCDDGNNVNGDGCSSTCLLEGQICTEICSGGAVDFELVFDRSGSMNRYLDPPADNIFQRITKIKSARDAASKLAESALNKNSATKIGLSTFSTDAVSEVSMTSNFNTINSGILQLYANGNADTNYNESIIKAVDKLVSQGRNTAPNVIIFLSDGAPTVANSFDETGTFTDPIDIESSISAANYAKSKNVMIVTVGFGRRSEINEQVLKDMAQITHGQYFFVDSYTQIIQLYENLGNNTCELVCVNETIECDNNNDCNDNNQNTQDICLNPGTTQSQCVHNNIRCFTNSDCNDNNQQTTDICENPGTPQSFCRYENLQCINDAQCGIQISNLICQGNNLVNRTQTPDCTLTNTCTTIIDNTIVHNCQYGCNNGACIQPNIACSNDGQCNDNNIRTVDQCVNPNTPQSYCLNTEVNCLNNLECGITGFIDGEFCSLNDVYKTFQNATCMNPGTLQSNCVVSRSPRLVLDCNDNNQNTQDSCSNGICVFTQIGECNNDLDCNDNNQNTQDQCVNNQCRHQTIICFTNSDCNDNNQQTTDICENPGTPQSFCRYENLQCINDAQCGIQISNLICQGNNLVNRTQTPDCTLTNTCTTIIDNTIVHNCQYGCNNGACIQPNIACSNDGQCNDNNIRTVDQCVNPNTPQSYCLNTEVNCLNNLECGITGFIDGEFCSLNDVYKTFQNATCLSPGTLQSSCRITQTQQLIQDCNDNNANTQDTCSNGICINTQIGECNVDIDCNDNNNHTIDQCINNQCRHQTIICFIDSDCNDNIQQTRDICINPGTVQSFCRHDLLQCINNTQCGSQSSILVCSGNNLVNRTITPTCTAENFCTSITNDALVQACQYGCNNAQCLPRPICFTDAECNDNNAYTQDLCINPGTQQSFCQHNIIRCITNNDCNDNNQQTMDVCINPGTVNSFCQNNLLQCINNAQCGSQTSQVICQGNNRINITQTPICNINNLCQTQTTNTTLQNCQYGCQNGVCLPQPQCTTNSQCGTVTSQLFCDGNNIINRTQTPQCINNNCNTQTTNTFVQTCPYGCLNAACLPQPQQNDTIINITDNPDNFDKTCPAMPWIGGDQNTQRYIDLKQPVQTSLQQGQTYNFYCTVGDQVQPGSPVTLTLDNEFHQIEINNQNHRFSKYNGIGYNKYEPIPITIPGTDYGFINAGNDTYKYYVKVDAQGKLYLRVKRDMGVKERFRSFNVNVEAGSPPIVYDIYYTRQNTCPIYSSPLWPDTWFHGNDDILIFGKGANNVDDELRGLNCVIKAI